MSPPKLAIVIGTLERGGTEGQIVELVRGAHPVRAECVVICLGHAGPLAADIRAVGARVVALGASGRSAVPSLVPRLPLALRRERPDVIYAFLFWSYSLALPMAAGVVPRACRIAARRALPEFDVPRQRTLVGLRRVANRLSHGVIVNSAAVRDAWLRAEPELGGRVWVVENGVRAAAEPAPGSPGDGVTLVCVANLIAYKGHRTLLGALGRLRADDRPGWRMLLVGEGPERSAIQEGLAARGLAGRVSLLGRRGDVADILRTSDLAVLASHGEGMPNAVLEAMAQGMPVVATGVGGVPRLLGSGAGLVVPPHDERALARALQSMIDDPTLRRRAGAEGLRVARTELGTERMGDQTFAAIAEICRRRPT